MSLRLDQARAKHGGAVAKFQHVAGLDGFRGAAVLLVMVYHLGHFLRGGHIGVNAFFVLSGFLITSLLLREYAGTGRIAIGRFYVRRALRLYPALLGLIAAVTAYALLVPGAAFGKESLSSTPAALFYFSNWVRAFSDAEMPLGLYEHTWSLSVEEQFYFVWPLVLWGVLALTRRLWAVGAVAVAGCVGALVVRLSVEPGLAGARVYSGFDTQADQLLFGCALAVLVLMASEYGFTGGLARSLRVAVWPAVAFLAGAAVLWTPGATSLPALLLMSVVAMACAVVVGYLYLNPSTLMSRLLASKPMVYVGKRSYALYLWHLPIYIVMMAGDFPANNLARVVLQVVLSFVAAELSWRFVEKPFLAVKKRMEVKRERQDAATPSSS